MISRRVALDVATAGQGLELPYRGTGVFVQRCDGDGIELRLDEAQAGVPLVAGRRFAVDFDRLYVVIPSAVPSGVLELVILDRAGQDVRDA